MKSYAKFSVILLLMLTLLLTSCGKTISVEPEAPMVTEKEQANQATEVGTTASNEATEASMTKDQEDAADETSEAETEEAEIEVGLFDRALLESIDFKWPDSYRMVTREEDNSGVAIITTYQKGYSSREERVSEGVTEIDIYNDKEGITYNYILGETTGTSYIDDEEDQLALEEEMAMEGQSLMSLFEQDVWADMKILADRDTVNGRKAIMIEMVSPDSEEASEGSMKFWFDTKYTVPLKMVVDFGESWKSTSEATDIEFNLKLDDDLFEAPKGVTFTEY